MRALARGPVLLDLVQELGALCSSVVDEGLDVLLQTLDRLPHFHIPGLRALQAGLEIEKLLVRALILVDHGAPLSLEGLVLALLCPDPLVLQKAVEGDSQLPHQGRLLMSRLHQPVLIRAVLLELLLEELLLVVGDRLLVQDQYL